MTSQRVLFLSVIGFMTLVLAFYLVVGVMDA
ncbi:MAG: hypothetical protein JWM93_623 [Frankiales bacterium]|nr:hypothetical protein [Frankiales bacterium]